MLETTVHINTCINAPDSGTEALNGPEFVPLARLSIVNFKGNILTNLIRASSDHHH